MLSVPGMLMERTNWRIEDLVYTPRLLRRVEAVLRYYTKDGYQMINRSFQYNIRPEVQSTFLRYALELAIPVYDEITVYRGCGESEARNLLRAIEEENSVLDYDFPVSTSLFQRIAEGFVDEVTLFQTEHAAYVGYSALLIIRLPSNIPVIYAGAFSSCEDEYEVIIPPRTRLYIESVEQKFDPEEPSFTVNVYARADVSLREVEDEYVDEELVGNWASHAGVNLDDDDEFDEE